MKLVEQLEKYLLWVVIFLFPLLVLPSFANSYDTPKLAVLVGGISLVVLIKAIKTILKGSLEYSRGSFDLPVLVLALAYLLSALFKTPNKMDAFFLPGTASLVIGGSLLYFLINSLGASAKRLTATAFYFSGVVIALVGLLAFSGISAQIPFFPAFMKDSTFTLLGGQFPAALFLGTTFLVGLGLTLSEKDFARKAFSWVSLVILGLGLAISVFNSLPGKATSPTLPPFTQTWAVGVEAIKESPLLGIGPGNYLTAFNRFRPLSYNNTALWPLRFTVAADWPLTILAEAGLLGVGGFVLLISLFLKRIKGFKWAENLEESLNFSALGLGFVLLLVFPVNPSLTVAFFLLLSLSSQPFPLRVNLASAGDTPGRLPAYLIGLPLIVFSLALGYFTGRALLAEATFKGGLDALTNKNGAVANNLMFQAIKLNPYVDRYRGTFSQVNMAIARSLAQKENLTEEERQVIAQRIQLAISEGKATVTLNPQRAGNWDVLGRTYQAIMPFAQGADTFTIQTFTQAVSLDPINPNLRIALGGVYFALGRFDEAIRVFELAVLAKPDLANAHYNLAIAYREKGEIEKAIEQVNIVLSQVNKDSSDYQLAKAELESLEKKRPVAVPEEGETLTPPQEAEAPVIVPPLTLPEESTPPATTQ
jgi:tetratricopeptide (TPR) repeat protein